MDFERKLSLLKNKKEVDYQQLNRWLETFLKYVSLEGTNIEQSYPNIKRGSILLVNFGYRVHSEFRYNHYAVALNSSPKKNGKVTVIPLTSKEHPNQLPLGHELGERLEDLIVKKERSLFWKPYRELASKVFEETGVRFFPPAIGGYNTVYPSCTSFICKIKETLVKDSLLHKDADTILSDLKIFKAFIKKSPNLFKSSYLRIEDITTISKVRILLPKNTNHPLYRLRLSNTTLDKLDNEIIRLYTGKQTY